MIYWFHEDDNCSEAAAKQHNINAQTGPEKHKWRRYVDYETYENLLSKLEFLKGNNWLVLAKDNMMLDEQNNMMRTALEFYASLDWKPNAEAWSGPARNALEKCSTPRTKSE